MKNWLIKKLGGYTQMETKLAVLGADTLWKQRISDPKRLKLWKTIIQKENEMEKGMTHAFAFTVKLNKKLNKMAGISRFINTKK
jgi:hypothetical protein